MSQSHRFTWSLLALLLTAGDARAQVTTTPLAPWYRRARVLELTGTNPRDSVVLTATGKRADSLAIVMTFYVAGAVAYRQRWTSDDELIDVDSLRTMPAKLIAFVRARLDGDLASVKRERINAEQAKHMGDQAVLRAIVPRPTHQVVLSFGYENSQFYVWNPARRQLVVFMECC